MGGARLSLSNAVLGDRRRAAHARRLAAWPLRHTAIRGHVSSVYPLLSCRRGERRVRPLSRPRGAGIKKSRRISSTAKGVALNAQAKPDPSAV
ncbi:hypothetical protein BSIN_0191 [Burkholderia singularis]|uniref:Uncharacterized protein n=1 Tax=Burkholderia singularis TaxID=1503053 RepID=A0A238H2E7_9BURK|nr:hypothetical protein BSIN_0191 [Burkholderia singularis]